ncbi:GTP pyrophosphokinase [Aminobacter aminovorans]|nr:GTP pyrophosphokinase [Aminobacter aminovorans]
MLRQTRTQIDKAKQPYILHPLRVMLAVDSDGERMAAVLHDVVEDTEFTLGDLRTRGFPAGVVEAVDALTRRDDEPYPDFINRARSNEIARRVKIADILDNTTPERVRAAGLGQQYLDRYREALQMLTDAESQS